MVLPPPMRLPCLPVCLFVCYYDYAQMDLDDTRAARRLAKWHRPEVMRVLSRVSVTETAREGGCSGRNGPWNKYSLMVIGCDDTTSDYGVFTLTEDFPKTRKVKDVCFESDSKIRQWLAVT